MDTKKKKHNRFAKRLLNKYRLVILNEDTFEEQVSFKLNRLNVFVLFSLGTIVLVSCTTFLIAFTPLREYIPGYSSTALNKKATDVAEATDSLSQVIRINDQYFNSIRKVLNGEVKGVEFNKDSAVVATKIDPDKINLKPSEEDMKLREEVFGEDKYSLFETAKTNINMARLFPPVKGSITSHYNSGDRHYAIDIAVALHTAVKSVADGTVIFAEWTATTGYVMIVEHGNNLLSVYKHNSSLSKRQGDLVRAGEVIATAGSTGELSTGPHLHFELWSDGYSVNPTDFIDFD